MSLTLDLIFLSFSYDKFIRKFKLSFRDEIEIIEKDKITFSIPEYIFRYGKDKEVVDIILYYDNKITQKNQKYKFHVYYGKNKIYIQINELCPFVYEIIFKNILDVKIMKNLFEFNELDDLGNKYRKRLTLINYDSSIITINEKMIILGDIIARNLLETETNYAFNQIRIQDLENNKFIIQPIIGQKEYDIKFLEYNKAKLITFESHFNELLKTESSKYKELENNIIDKFKNIKEHGSLNLNRDEDYLNKIFDNNSKLY